MSPLADLTWIQRLDRTLLHWINCDLHAPWLQDVLFTLQSKDVGIPLVLVLIAGIHLAKGRRVALRTLATCGLGFLLSWQVAVGLWAVFERDRPPRVLETVLRTDAEIAACGEHPTSVSVRKYVSRRPGLPSQHAQHSALFAAALFLAVRWLGIAAALYAVLVAWTRVYMGVHWPTDVLLGLAIGPPLGLLTWWLVPRLLGLVGRRHWVEAPAAPTESAEAGGPEDTGR